MVFSSSRMALVLVSSLLALGGNGVGAQSSGSSSSSSNAVGNTLYTKSVTYCAPPTGILVQDFQFQYYEKNNSAYFQLSAASVQNNLNLAAQVTVDAYGMSALNWTINLCDVLGGLLCPLPVISFSGGSALPVPDGVTDSLPSIAYTVPDLQAFAQVQFRDVNTNTVVACIQATLSNGHTTRLPAVLWATAGVALLAVLVSWFHTAWNICRSDPKIKDRDELVTGSSSPGQWRVVDVIFMFQSIAATGLLSIEFPNVYRSFVLNFQWAMGIFHTDRIQTAIDRARSMTGAKLSSTAYPETAFVNRKSIYTTPIGGGDVSSVPTFSGYVIPMVKRFEDFLAPATYANPVSHTPSPYSYPTLGSRALVPDDSASNATTQLPAGLPVYVNSLNVSVANAFMTVFFTWLFIWVAFWGLHLILWAVLMITTKAGKRVTWKGEKRVTAGEGWAWRLRHNFGLFVMTNVLRMNLMLFFPVAIFSMYQFTLNDAWLPIFLAAIVLAITVLTLLIAEGTLLLAAHRSHSSVPTTRTSIAPSSRRASRRQSMSSRPQSRASYPQSSVADSDDLNDADSMVVTHHKAMFSPFPTFRPLCSALYQQYRRPLHSFWLLPLLFSTFAKACFLAFAQGHGLVQLIGLVIIEGLTFILLVAFRPHTNKKGDWLSATLSLLRLVAMGLLFAFFDRLNATGIVKTVIGLVSVAVWGIAVVLLFFGIIYNLFWGLLWKRHTPSAPMDVEDIDDGRSTRGPHPVMLEGNENEREYPDNRRLSQISTAVEDQSAKDKLSATGFTPISENEEHQHHDNAYGGYYSEAQPPFLNENNRNQTSYIIQEEDLQPSIPPPIGTPVPLATDQPQQRSMGPPASTTPMQMSESRRQSYPQNTSSSGVELAPPIAAFAGVGAGGGGGNMPTFTPSGQTPYYDAMENTPMGGQTPRAGGEGGGYFTRGR